MATILSPEEMMERVVLERARLLNGLPPTPPPPPQQDYGLSNPWIKKVHDTIQEGLQQRAKDAVQSGIDPREAAQQANSAVGQAMLTAATPPETPVAKIIEERVLPDALGEYKPLVASILDFDPNDVVGGFVLKGAKAAAKPVTKMDAVAKAKAKFYDSLEGLKGFNQEVYDQARLYPGSARKAEERIKEFNKALDPIKAKGVKENIQDFADTMLGRPNRLERAGKWAALERLEEAAKITGGPVNGKDAAGWAEELAKYKKTLPDDELARIGVTRDAAVKEFNKDLDLNVAAGLISKEAAEAAKAKGLKYVPLHMLADDAAEELGGVVGGHSANPNVDWFKRLQKGAKEVQIENPFDAAVKRLSPAQRNRDKNLVMRTLVELPEKDEAYKGLVIPLETAAMRKERIALSQDLLATQRKVNEVAAQIGLKGKVSDNLWDRFNRVIGEQANLAGELANKNIEFEPRAEVMKTIEKIQRRQKNMLVTANKMKDNSASMGPLVKEITDAETEISRLKYDIWKIQASPLPEGYKQIYHFRDGMRERWAVPADIADTLMRMNKEQVDMVTAIAAKSSSLLRFGAVTSNMVFAPTNVLRDATFAGERSLYDLNPANMLPVVGYRWLDGLYEALGAPGRTRKILKEYIEAGGGMASFGEVINARPTRTAQGWGARAANFPKNVVKNPTELFEAVFRPMTAANEALDLGPRLAEYKAALRAGEPASKAALAGRDITVDFWKAGDFGRVANMWVPFLNARLQGITNTIKSLKSGNPKTYLKIGAGVGLPSSITYMWNTTKFPHVWDNLSLQDKNENIILIRGDEQDEQGYYTNVIRIPKNDFAKLIANPIEQGLDYTRKQAPIEYGAIAARLLGTLSPIGGVDEKGNISTTDAFSNALPPLMKAPMEMKTNQNFYTNRPIDPEYMQARSPQYRYYPGETNQSYVWAGRKVAELEAALGLAPNADDAQGISPLKMQQFFRSTTGPLVETITNPGSLGDQFKRRFGKAYGGQIERDQIEELDKLAQKEENARARFLILLKERISTPRSERKPITEKEITTFVEGAPTGEGAAKRLAESIRDRNELTSLESRLKNGGYPAEVKENWAKGYLNTLSEEERKDKLKRWREYKVLSGASIDRLQKEIK